MLLDEVVLKNERLFLGFGKDAVQVVDSLANGFKMYFWGVIFPLPVLIVAVPAILLLAGGSTVFSGGGLPQPQAFRTVPIMIIGGAIGLVTALSVPSVLAHMAQKHTYRAWSLPLMVVTSVRNIVPTLYLGLIGLVAAILPIAVIGGGVAVNFYVLKVAFNTPHFLAWTPLSTFSGVTEGAEVGVSFPWTAVGGYAGTIVVASLFGIVHSGFFQFLLLVFEEGVFRFGRWLPVS